MSVESAGLPARRWTRLVQWADRIGLGRKAAIALTVTAVVLSFVTYAALSGWGAVRTDVRTILILLNIDLVLFLALGAVVARRLVQLWMERRRGAVGSRLHTRLVVLFSLIAVTPTIIISVSSALFFSLGVQAWFSDRVRTALSESHAVAQAYLKEHQQTIRGDILAMARDIGRAAPIIAEDPVRFQRLVSTQAALRSLSEATVLHSSGQIVTRWSNLGFVLFDEKPPSWALERAREGEPILLTSDTEDRIRAVVKIDRFVDLYLYVSRFVEPGVIAHIERTQSAVSRYEELEGKRTEIEITFAMMFVLVALLLLAAAIWVGLTFATRLAKPISALVNAAERVRGGDLATRVNEDEASDEVGTLSRAFNRMTEQLSAQREGLVDANRQLDERRHFIETVLAGVSSGIIGLDGKGAVKLANRAATELTATSLDNALGRHLDELIPECAELLEQALAAPSQAVGGQVVLRRNSQRQTLLVRLSPDSTSGDHGFVVTFDDISELLQAQRKAAWSDVARRIAHEIKNPLTPIQLAAERLRRKYQGEIVSDPETFISCTDTIIRQVGDIGRLVDEFSSFARMPAPTMKSEDLAALCRESVVLFRSAHRGISFDCQFDDIAVPISCDRHQIGQALINLLQNAVDAIEGRDGSAEGEAKGHIAIEIERLGDRVAIAVADDGRGLPHDERERLTEPYVTTREKGTGLGLAIVKKIMEDHGGTVGLADRPGGGAIVRLIFAADSYVLEDDDGTQSESAEHSRRSGKMV